jgi:hypothetical protein
MQPAIEVGTLEDITVGRPFKGRIANYNVVIQPYRPSRLFLSEQSSDGTVLGEYPSAITGTRSV